MWCISQTTPPTRQSDANCVVVAALVNQSKDFSGDTHLEHDSACRAPGRGSKLHHTLPRREAEAHQRSSRAAGAAGWRAAGGSSPPHIGEGRVRTKVRRHAPWRHRQGLQPRVARPGAGSLTPARASGEDTGRRSGRHPAARMRGWRGREPAGDGTGGRSRRQLWISGETSRKAREQRSRGFLQAATWTADGRSLSSPSRAAHGLCPAATSGDGWEGGGVGRGWRRRARVCPSRRPEETT